MVIELAQIKRGNKVESLHFGHLCHIDSQRQINNFDSSNFCCFTRSIIKPIQAKVSLDILGDLISDEDLAIGSASHVATEQSLELVKNLLAKFGNSQELLRCGTYSDSGKSIPSKLHHNCSGKHSLILATCKQQNWSANYNQISHPIQQLILEELKRLSSKKQIETAVDGCGLPTFYLSLEEMALCFLSLIIDPAYSRIINAMNKFPSIIGGAKQIDTLLMQHYPNRFIAKGGAEGLMVIGNLTKQEVLIMKIIDGSSRAKSFVSKVLLEKLGWIEKDSIEIDSKIYNSNGDVVGLMTSQL